MRRKLPPALARHCWQPGQSGNPSGHSGAYGEAISLARQAAPDAVRRLVQLMGSDDERVVVVACNAILDRALGKPREQPHDRDPMENYANMSDEARMRWAYGVLQQARQVLDAPGDDHDEGRR